MNRPPSFLYAAMAMAGGVAWLAVGLELWFGPIVPTAQASALPVRQWVPGLHALFAAVFLASLAWRPRRAVHLLLAAALVGMALLLVALYRYNSAAALLIIPMLTFATLLPTRGLVAVYAIANLLLLAIVLAFRQMDTPYTYVGLHASLQLLAILLVTSMLRTEHARAQLAQAHAELLATRGVLAEIARGQERLRLSRELHDVAGHKLTALRLNLSALKHNPQLDQAQTIALCTSLTEELLDDLRAVVHQLRLHDGLDLSAALQSMAAPFPRPRVQLDIAGHARVQTVEQADALLRAFQEGLTNAARHGDAAQLWVRLHRDGDEIVLDMRDDGQGSGAPQAGHGLTGMHERLQALGGGLEFGHVNGHGFHLRAWLPVCP
ncbi:sensor histidine kinase [Dyella sp. BiH032]|uniref:sensor histidine kinase n=1 Tax=Dyella sp. BiH032 TaxID=3075430 RepID=UPI0028936BD2|nr:sensor histidine kinase [Dyella sp. BiH032]WNL48088.1 sensor histidine kinase [Dyella sp. BiH032]